MGGHVDGKVVCLLQRFFSFLSLAFLNFVFDFLKTLPLVVLFLVGLICRSLGVGAFH